MQDATIIAEPLEKTYTLNISGVKFITQLVGTHNEQALLQVLNSPYFLQMVVKIEDLKGLKEKLQNEVGSNAKSGSGVSKMSKFGGKKSRRKRK